MQWPQQVGGTRPGQHIQGQQAVPQKNAAPKQWAGQAGSPAFTKPQPGGPRVPDMGANSECTLSMHSLSHALIRSSACTMGTLHLAPWKGSSSPKCQKSTCHPGELRCPGRPCRVAGGHQGLSPVFSPRWTAWEAG